MATGYPLILWLKAIGRRWWALMSCAAFTFLGVYATFFDKSGPWTIRVVFGLAAVFLFVAMYLAWKEQYDKAEAAQPNFDLQVDSAFSHAEGGKTLIVLGVRIVNKGSPSSVLGYQVKYSSPTFDQVAQLVFVKNTDGTDQMSFKLPSGAVFAFRGGEAIYMRTDPIPRGGFISGRLPVWVDGHRHRDVVDGTAMIEVTIIDYLGATTTTSFRSKGESAQPTYITGEPISVQNRGLLVGDTGGAATPTTKKERRKKQRKN